MSSTPTPKVTTATTAAPIMAASETPAPIAAIYYGTPDEIGDEPATENEDNDSAPTLATILDLGPIGGPATLRL